MNNEEILKLCKEKYPIGTKIGCARDANYHGIGYIEDQNFVVNERGEVYTHFTTGSHNQYLYDQGKWAEIIKTHTNKEFLIY